MFSKVSKPPNEHREDGPTPRPHHEVRGIRGGGRVRVPPRLLRKYAVSEMTAPRRVERRERLFHPGIVARGWATKRSSRNSFSHIWTKKVRVFPGRIWARKTSVFLVRGDTHDDPPLLTG